MSKSLKKRFEELLGDFLNSKFPDKEIESKIKKIAKDFKISITEVRKLFKSEVDNLVGK
jgi:hypothetical protein